MIRLASDPAAWVRKPKWQSVDGVSLSALPSLPGTVPCGTPDPQAAPPALRFSPGALGVDAEAEISMRDWASLLGAVKDRLRLALGPHGASADSAEQRSGAASLASQVLECVQALDQLHATLLCKLERCPQREVGLNDPARAPGVADRSGTRA